MSHPFTIKYMMEGELFSTETDANGTKLQEIQQKSKANKRQIKARPSRKICEKTSVADRCKTALDGEPRGSMDEINKEINATVPYNERVTFFKILGMAMRRRMRMFAEEASIVGLSYLVKVSSFKVGSIIRKVFWTMLLLFGVGFMVFQIYDRISYYLSYPTIVKYRVAYNQSLRFPTVTICSEFLVSKKALASFGPETRSLTAIRYPPFWDTEFGESFRYYSFSQYDFDWELFYNEVHFDMEEMMLECWFGNIPCNSRNAIKKVSTDQGFCLSFNPVEANYATTHPGANLGLRIVLWVNQSDCYLTMTPGVGFKVVLHDPLEEPLVQTVGFRVGTGVTTSVEFSFRNLSMLPSPYGDCRQDGNYTLMKCMTKCVNDFTVSGCNCRHQGSQGTEKICSLDQYYYCVTKDIKWFISSGQSRNCDCPLQCHQPTYPFSISTNPLSQHFLNYMSQRSQFKGRNLTMSKLSKELVFLDIFYSQLSYVNIQTIPAYDILTLVCDIGGALGLILGGTILTIAEIAQLFVEIFISIVTSARFAKMQRC